MALIDLGKSIARSTATIMLMLALFACASTPRTAPVSSAPLSGDDERGRWTIVLGTFAGDGHAQQARVVRQQVTASVAEVQSARVHTTERGSMLICGSYAAVDDPRAKSDLARIKEATFNDMPVFARAFLAPMPASRTTGPQSAPAGAYDLMTARERRPNTNPLYTVQVALWGDFDSGRLTVAEIRRQAETYAQRLRSEGHEAYVYHDDAAKQSLVTVGLFDHTAMDPTTGEFNVEVRALMRRFPAHLVNGEELQEPIDRRRPDRGTRAQRPSLVIVPRQ